MIIEEIRNIRSSKRDLRNFGLTVGIALGILGGLFLWKAKSYYHYLLLAGCISVLLGLIFPSALRHVQKIWMTFAILLGWVMTRVILSIVYYLVLTPIAIIARLCGKRFLDREWDRSPNTYWRYRKSKESDERDYERQF